MTLDDDIGERVTITVECSEPLERPIGFYPLKDRSTAPCDEIPLFSDFERGIYCGIFIGSIIWAVVHRLAGFG